MAFRILSLDGGGTWALIQLKALIALYKPETNGHTVLQDFDLVAANSGGSIVLGGLIEGLTLAQMLAFFETETTRQSIFSPTHSLEDKILHGLTKMGPKYSAANKLPALQKVFGSKGGLPLATAASGIKGPQGNDVHILVIGFDYDRNRAAFFRSAPTSGPHWGSGETADKTTLAEVVHASSNAPVNYFDGPATFQSGPGRYWDGAISGNNNPVLAAVAEAIMLHQNPLNLAVLSIGTASVALPWPRPQDDSYSPYIRQPAKQGFVDDLHKLATSILDDPPDAATFLAHVMTGGGAGLPSPLTSRIVRMNPLISPVKAGDTWTAPDSMDDDAFTFLRDLDMDAVKQPEADAISAYADLWVNGIAPNQPIRMNGDTLEPELGHTRFPDARAAWKALQ